MLPRPIHVPDALSDSTREAFVSLIRDTREVWEFRELLYNFTMRELRGKYKGTALGWGWSLVNPLMTAAIYTLVFSTIKYSFVNFRKHDKETVQNGRPALLSRMKKHFETVANDALPSGVFFTACGVRS